VGQKVPKQSHEGTNDHEGLRRGYWGGGGGRDENPDLSEIYLFSGVVRASETGVDMSLCCLSTVPSAFGDRLVTAARVLFVLVFVFWGGIIFGVAFFP